MPGKGEYLGDTRVSEPAQPAVAPVSRARTAAKPPKRVLIVNARRDEQRFVSYRRAVELVEVEKKARWTAASSNPLLQKGIILDRGKLRPPTPREMQQMRQQLNEQRIVDGRGGTIWWNGCDPSENAHHLPFQNRTIPLQEDANRAEWLAIEAHEPQHSDLCGFDCPINRRIALDAAIAEYNAAVTARSLGETKLRKPRRFIK